MTNKIKLTESQLHEVIKESINNVLYEFTKKPRVIKNPDRYMKRLTNKGKVQQVYKNQNVNARPVNDDEVGTILTTYKKDPSVYDTNDNNIEVSKPLERGQYIVNNLAKPWQKYAVDAKTFNKKYSASETDPNLYIPKGEDMIASKPLRRGVRFKPKNWGGYEASVDKGGRMMQSTKDKSDIYPIQKSDFEGTYAPRTESKLHRIVKESIDNVLRDSRLDSITDQIDFYVNVSQERPLSPQQIEQLKDLRDTVITFGEAGERWAQVADDILQENGYEDDTMSYYR